MTGSHENAVLAMAQGTVDMSAGRWRAPNDSNLTRMIREGMVKESNGKLVTKDGFRIILKAAMRTAFLDAAKNDKAAFDRLSDGKNRPWEPTDNGAYDDTINLIRFVDRLNKKEA